MIPMMFEITVMLLSLFTVCGSNLSSNLSLLLFCRPIIPEDVIEMQKTLGITNCPIKNCLEDMWVWEVENHLK